jgi:hypothetical protein
MARYIITQTQSHNLIYKILDEEFTTTEKEENPYNPNAYVLNIFNKQNKDLLVYFWYGPGEDDDGNPHNGVGSLHIDYTLIDFFRKYLNLRETKTMDIVADWVSEKYDVDIDEVAIHPTKQE